MRVVDELTPRKYWRRSLAKDGRDLNLNLKFESECCGVRVLRAAASAEIDFFNLTSEEHWQTPIEYVLRSMILAMWFWVSERNFTKTAKKQKKLTFPPFPSINLPVRFEEIAKECGRDEVSIAAIFYAQAKPSVCTQLYFILTFSRKTCTTYPRLWKSPGRPGRGIWGSPLPRQS